MAKRTARRSRTAGRSSKQRNEVPTWMAAAVVIMGGVALSFPMGLADSIYNGGIFASGTHASGSQIAPQFARGGDGGGLLCKDSDSSGPTPIYQYTVQGTCNDWAGQSHTDYCYDETRLVEFSCIDGHCAREMVNCPRIGFDGCMDGACVDFSDSDDGNQTMPDLTVMSMSIGIQGNATTSEVTIVGTIKNVGNAPANWSLTHFNIMPLGLNHSESIASLQPGESVNQTAVFGLPDGNYTIRITTDYLNSVAESNENNNVLSQDFIV